MEWKTNLFGYSKIFHFLFPKFLLTFPYHEFSLHHSTFCHQHFVLKLCKMWLFIACVPHLCNLLRQYTHSVENPLRNLISDVYLTSSRELTQTQIVKDYKLRYYMISTAGIIHCALWVCWETKLMGIDKSQVQFL